MIPEESGPLQLIQCVLPYAIQLIRESLDDTKPQRHKAPTTRQMGSCGTQRGSLLGDHSDDSEADGRTEIARRSTEAVDRAIEAALRSPPVRSSATGKRNSPKSAALTTLPYI